jgi:hypothetical protein
MELRSSCGLTFPATRSALVQVSVLALCGLFSLNALAFNSTLQPEDVEAAFYLGQSSDRAKVDNFLHQYKHDFLVPTDNSVAYVSSVEFQTPYEQVVLRSMQTLQYTRFRAREDYQANPSLVIVRAVVALKTGYTGSPPPADSFKVVVAQVKPIEPMNVASTVLCDPFATTLENPTLGNCIAYTREILLQFDAKQFAPGRATVKVTLPSGKSMETTYNLDRLK